MMSTPPLRWSSLLLTLLMALTLGLPVMAQDGGGRPQRGQGGPGQGQRWQDMTEEEREQFREQMQERMAERERQQAEQLRERLEMSEEDFEVIGPMIQKVQQLVRERDMANRGGGRGAPGQRGGGGQQGGPGGGGFGIELSEGAQAISSAMTELRTALEEDDSGDIKSSLTKLRAARAAMDKQIADAREELRSVLTAKWEAEMVVLGVLD